MQVVTVKYEFLKNLGNFQHEKLGVEVQVEPGESPFEALQRAKKFVRGCLATFSEFDIEKAKRITANPDDYTVKQFREAQDLLALAEKTEVPF
ncbi:MAG: hypothetical protein U0350_39885 [Caldilineaceae bacterium]